MEFGILLRLVGVRTSYSFYLVDWEENPTDMI